VRILVRDGLELFAGFGGAFPVEAKLGDQARRDAGRTQLSSIVRTAGFNRALALWPAGSGSTSRKTGGQHHRQNRAPMTSFACAPPTNDVASAAPIVARLIDPL